MEVWIFKQLVVKFREGAGSQSRCPDDSWPPFSTQRRSNSAFSVTDLSNWIAQLDLPNPVPCSTPARLESVDAIRFFKC